MFYTETTNTQNSRQEVKLVLSSLTPEDAFSKFMYSLGVLSGTLHEYIYKYCNGKNLNDVSTV